MITVTPDEDPWTICQFVAAANQRAVLQSVELSPLGSTGASAPLDFEVGVQTTAGDLSAGSFQATVPTPSETIQTSVIYKTSGDAEPAATTVLETFSLHQQATMRWYPQAGEIIIEGGTRLGLLYKSSTYVAMQVCCKLEE
jgi:hypothetical protein